jgi:hypothetical protein
MQQFVSSLLEFLCCRTHGRGVPDIEFDLSRGTGRPAGHSGLPKHASAAWESGHEGGMGLRKCIETPLAWNPF